MEVTTVLRAVAGNSTFLHGQSSGVICHPLQNIHSTGIFNGDGIMKSAFPLLMMQICLLTVITRAVRFIFRPLKQPTAILDIIGGIIIGPTLLGRSQTFSRLFFPSESFNIVATLAKIGTIYYFLIQGLKIDPMWIRKSTKREVVIAVSGMLVPIILFVCMDHITEKLQGGVFIKGLSAIGLIMSLTMFSTLHPMLEELNLLNLELGRIVLYASLINFVISSAGMVTIDFVRNGRANPLMGLMYLLCLLSVGIFVVFIIRPIAMWIVRQTGEGGVVERRYIFGFQFMTMVMGFIGNILGSSVFNGPLMMGLAMPDGPPLASAILEKTETLVNAIFLPLFYASVGLRSDIFGVTNWAALMKLHALVFAGFIGKLAGTLVPALYYKIPFRDALALGLTMNFHGIVEIMLFVHWHDGKVIGDQEYGALVVAILLITVISAPIVQILTKNAKPYKPYNRRTIEHFKPKAELCLLTCIHSQDNVPTVIRLLEASHSNSENPVCVYVLNLFELVGRAIPLLVEHDTLKRSSSMNQSNHIVSAFRNYEQRNKGCVAIRPFTSMAPYNTMHHDICKLALDNKVSLVIIPHHRQQTIGGVEVVDRAFRTINPQVLAQAPCSVGILVDNAVQSGNATYSSGNLQYRVGVLILGGCDCRDVLSYALRMVGNPNVKLTVMRLVPAVDGKDHLTERQLDNQLVAHFRIKCAGNSRVAYIEETVSNGEETLAAIRSMGDDFDLIMVGRRLGIDTSFLEGLTDWSNSPELGVIGDIVAAPDFYQTPVSVLVVQQGQHGGSGGPS